MTSSAILLLILSIIICDGRSKVVTGSNNVTNERVDALLRTFLMYNLTTSCRSSIDRISRYLSAFDSLPDQKQFFYDSFGEGKVTELVTDSQFQRNMLKCLKSSAEKEYSQSEYPLDYCYGYDDKLQESSSKAYTICVPSTCESDNLLLLNIWRERSSEITSNTSLNTISCVRSRHSDQWYTKMAPLMSLLCILGLFLIVCLSTIYHVQRESTSKSLCTTFFLAFSAKANLPQLFRKPKKDGSTITCMFGIRSLTIIWIVIGHSFAWIEPYLGNPAVYRSDIADNFLNQWISNFLLTVDVFLVLGGTVNAYGFFRKMEKMEPRPGWSSFAYWLKFYRHRVVRLWPAYAYTLLGVLLLSNLHYHAMWPELDPAAQCPAHWWENLLFVSSLFDNRCMGWTWYIGTEFIMYLLSPIFLLSFMHSERLGLAVSIVVILLSSALRAMAMVLFNLPPTQLGWNTPPIFNANYWQHFSQMYIKPQYRIGPYIVGIILGYYLNRFRDSRTEFPRKLMISGWFLAGIGAFISIYGLYPVLQGWVWPVYYVIYGAMHRTVFACALAWLIFACHCGYGGLMNTFLSLSVFIVPSSLSYAAYLSHMPLIFASYLQLPFPYQFTSKITIILQSFIRVILAYVLGFQCSMLSELPALNIERILLGGRQKQRKDNGQPHRMTLSDMPSGVNGNHR